jgi:hypothetical protein
VVRLSRDNRVVGGLSIICGLALALPQRFGQAPSFIRLAFHELFGSLPCSLPCGPRSTSIRHRSASWLSIPCELPHPQYFSAPSSSSRRNLRHPGFAPVPRHNLPQRLLSSFEDSKHAWVSLPTRPELDCLAAAFASATSFSLRRVRPKSAGIATT